MNRVIEKAGVKPWPKTFVNLRATRRTELEKLHEHHVVNYWLGHGSAIANKHYLQATDEDWADALRRGDNPTNLGDYGAITRMKKAEFPGENGFLTIRDAKRWQI